MKKTFIPSLLAVLVLIVVFGAFISSVNSPTQIARAGTGDNVSGWAWSENIGWISFNCTDTSCAASNYGVGIDTTTGYFSGFAYYDADDPTTAADEGAGWINFAPAAPYPAVGPINSTRLNSDGTVTGWARVCAVFADSSSCTGVLDLEAGGWDGWIKLSGSWSDGVRLVGNQFDGFAWSGDDTDAPADGVADVGIGWIDFHPTTGGVFFGDIPSGPECSDGIDNADPEDSLVDVDDPGCYDNASDITTYNPNEDEAPPFNQCSDWFDNDGDGYCDTAGGICRDGSIPGDTNCTTGGSNEFEAGGSNCTNNIIEGAEICSGTNLGGLDCSDFGFTGGTLGCSSDCLSFDTSSCTGAGCNNNGVCDSGETITSCPSDCFKIIEF